MGSLAAHLSKFAPQLSYCPSIELNVANNPAVKPHFSELLQWKWRVLMVSLNQSDMKTLDTLWLISKTVTSDQARSCTQ